MKRLCILATVLILALSIVSCTAPEQGGGELKILLLADFHYDSDVAAISKVLGDIKENVEYDFMICHGDIVNNSKDLVAGFFRVFDEHAILPPKYIATGNHDYDKVTGEWVLIDMEYKLYQSFELENRDDILWLVLADEAFGDPNIFSEEQLSWFKNRLQYAEDNSLIVFVSSHWPMPGTTEQSDTEGYHIEYGDADLIENMAGFENIQFWFSGHTHQRIDQQTQIVEKDGVVHVNLGSILPTRNKSSIPEWREIIIPNFGSRITIKDRNSQTEEWFATHTFKLKSALLK